MNRPFALLLAVSLPLAAAALASNVAASFAAMIATPGKAGTCKKTDQGQSCIWKGGKAYSTANALLASKTDYVFIINDPSFELTDFGAQQAAQKGFFKITAGPLKGSYIRKTYFQTARHRQFDLRSEAAYRRAD